ncbi:50S ribosomal protein L23 [Nitrosospira sp. Is2]|uniref:50S ribosomal protein L23 n=1 Tax=Nitrosospira sp. Is2 TaxID=3080532 RepID=UPI002955A8FE|nr:50S ribosomal protein L23 [Nitrosospira sp. Is2]WON73061.1 50S ribosomal protein L23 [Nitrosospira sp. Is2]
MNAQTFNAERLLQVIIAPQVSEKATYIAEKHNHVIFRVAQDATKSEIKAAIELIWKPQNIQVKSVQIANVKGKQKRFGRFIGRRSNWKKAYVSIQSDQEINFSDIAQGEVK